MVDASKCFFPAGCPGCSNCDPLRLAPPFVAVGEFELDVCVAGNPKPASEKSCGESTCVCAPPCKGSIDLANGQRLCKRYAAGGSAGPMCPECGWMMPNLQRLADLRLDDEMNEEQWVAREIAHSAKYGGVAIDRETALDLLHAAIRAGLVEVLADA